jgi:hypothetical protein
MSISIIERLPASPAALQTIRATPQSKRKLGAKSFGVRMVLSGHCHFPSEEVTRHQIWALNAIRLTIDVLSTCMFLPEKQILLMPPLFQVSRGCGSPGNCEHQNAGNFSGGPRNFILIVQVHNNGDLLVVIVEQSRGCFPTGAFF